MKRRIASFFLVIAVLSSMVPAAFATQPRDTEFFTDQYHTSLKFDQMEYRRIDVQPLLAQADAVGDLISDESNLEEVTRRFDELMRQLDEVETMAMIAYIRCFQDYTDTEAEEEYEFSSQESAMLLDKMSVLARDILNSPCAAAVDKHYTPEKQAELLGYAAKTEEQLALEARELELINRYWSKSEEVFSVEYEGREWTENGARDAYENEEIDKAAYKKIQELVSRKANQELGSIFLQLVELRGQIAELAGYNSYTEYAYEEIQNRDYTPREIRSFHETVKKHIVPLAKDTAEIYFQLITGDTEDFLYGEDYSGQIAVDAMEPYLSRLSDELVQAFAYMRSHGLYDLEEGEHKQDAAFCATLDCYGAAFIYAKPAGGIYDLQTLIHEFGHFNSAYWADPDFSKSTDICEVHSQGLEMLFTEFYPELFGEYGDAAEFDLADTMLYSNILSCIRMDELEQYAYAAQNLTLEQLNREFCRLSKEYGYIDADDPREQMYSWVEVHHLFDMPCYCVSYAVSAAGALVFWLEAQKDYLSAVDKYLQFVALDTSYGFQESFVQLGMNSPIDDEYIEDLATALRDALKVDERLAVAPEESPFTDIDVDAWYTAAVGYMYEHGLMQGTEEDTFNPYGTISRSDAVEILYRMEGSPAVEEHNLFEDVSAEAVCADVVSWAASNGIVSGYDDGTFRPEQAITREQAVTILWRYAQYKEIDVSVGESTDFLSFDDSFEVAEYAVPAMQWACGSGIVHGKNDSDGKGMVLDSDGKVTRAQIAVILTRFCEQIQ